MTDSRRVAITGAAGQLGRQLVIAFREAGYDVVPLSRPDFDITSADDLRRLAALRPDVIVNSAAWTDVDACARDPERAARINGKAAGQVAAVAAGVDALMVQISTNEVFDGELGRPYTELDEPRPINAYARSKLLGEQLVLEAGGRHLIVRTAWLFGPGGTNFVTKILAAAARAAAVGEALRVVYDEWGNPTWTPWLAGEIALAAAKEQTGVRHLAGAPWVSRLDWARAIVREAQVRVSVTPIPRTAFPRPSTPPARATLTSLQGPGGDWRHALHDFVSSLRAQDGLETHP